MEGTRFDELTRRLARWKTVSSDRRNVLKWAAASASAGGLAGPIFPISKPDAALAQEPDKRRAAGQPDIAKLAFDLEYDTDKIFSFVATRVRYEAYAGVLRGPIGALWGMAANSTDQALLLRGLLTEAMVETRIVVGELADDARVLLLDQVVLDAAAVATEHQTLTDFGTISRLAAGTSLAGTPVSESSLESVAQRAEAVRPRLLQSVRDQLSGTLDLLQTHLRDAGVSPSARPLALPDREVVRHMWVQVANGTDWLDLDPSVPGAKPGDRFASNPLPLDEFEDDDVHTVAIRVVADVVRNGAAVEEELLSYTAPSADLVGMPVSLIHAKPRMLAGAITAAIAGQEEYRPYLQVGETVTEGGPMLFNGQGGAAAAFGDESTREGEPIAERIVYTVLSPGEDPVIEIRTVFDRIGEADRASGNLPELISKLGPIETVIVDKDEGPTYLPLVTAANISVVSAPIPLLYFAQDFSVPDIAGDLAYQNHSYHFLRDMLGAELAAETGLRFARTRPVVTALEIGIQMDATGSQTFIYSLDLVQPTMASIGVSEVTPAVDAGLIEGVLNQVCESNFLEIGAQANPGVMDLTRTNVGLVFDAAASQGIAVRTILPDEHIPPEIGTEISADAAARIGEQLASGFAVVLPERAVELNGKRQTGWWAVDVETGRTLDRLESGRGSELAEEATLFDVVIHVAHHLYVLGMCVAGAMIYATSVVALIGGGGQGWVAGAVGGGATALGFCAALA